ncbi:FAD-dependent oxidoreductase, partial [candidate division KSB1 bacterium]
KWVETKTGFYADGTLHSMSNTFEFLRFPPLVLLDKFRLGLTILRAAHIRNWRKLETQTVSDWLRRWSGENTFAKIWQPLLRAKLGETYQSTSAAFIWATIQRMYAARKSGLKKEMFGYIPGGYARILDEISQQLTRENVRIENQRRAEKITSTPDSRLKVLFAQGAEETYDHLIITIPSPLAAGICPELTEEEKRQLNALQYLGVICASVLLKKPLSEYYVTNITDPGFPFTGVIEMSALVDRNFFSGNALVYLPKYVTHDDPAFELTDAEIEEQFLPALMRMHPELKAEDVTSFHVSRARRVFALSTLHYSEKLPPIRTSMPGVYILNSAHIVNGTLNVNETIKLADSTLPRILSR